MAEPTSLLNSNPDRRRPGATAVCMAAGEPIQEGGDIHGAVVLLLVVYARETLQEGVHQLAVGKGFEFEAAAEVTLKGFDQPTTVWKVVRSQ